MLKMAISKVTPICTSFKFQSSIHSAERQQRQLSLFSDQGFTTTTTTLSRKRRVDFDFDVTEKLNHKDRLSVSADVCRAVHGDSRALFSLLELEGLTNVTSEDIRRTQQPQFLTMTPAAIREKPTVRSRINPQNQQRIEGTNEALRAEAVSWLCDVCLDEACDAVVFPLAISFFDRVLAAKFIPRRNRQALASACLLLASKMKAPAPLTTEKIVYYTNGGVTMDELLDWEMLVLNQLEWNLLQATPFEFFDQMMVRSPLLECLREEFIPTLHKMQSELSLSTLLPSWQASACLLFVALKSKRRHLVRDSELCIRQHIRIDPKKLLECFPAIVKVAGPLVNDVVQPKPAETNQATAPTVHNNINTNSTSSNLPIAAMMPSNNGNPISVITPETSPDSDPNPPKRMHLITEDDNEAIVIVHAHSTHTSQKPQQTISGSSQVFEEFLLSRSTPAGYGPLF